eukprot:9104981-Lingulodinium_polyedra.AAC.1
MSSPWAPHGNCRMPTPASHPAATGVASRRGAASADHATTARLAASSWARCRWASATCAAKATAD